MTDEYTVLSVAWARRCNGAHTLQSLPLAALLLVLLCEPHELGEPPAPSGDVIADMIRAVSAIVARWRAEVSRDGDVTVRDLDEMGLRLDVLHELRRREKGGAA